MIVIYLITLHEKSHIVILNGQCWGYTMKYLILCTRPNYWHKNGCMKNTKINNTNSHGGGTGRWVKKMNQTKTALIIYY